MRHNDPVARGFSGHAESESQVRRRNAGQNETTDGTNVCINRRYRGRSDQAAVIRKRGASCQARSKTGTEIACEVVGKVRVVKDGLRGGGGWMT